MTPSFTYAAKVERVVDADTVDVELDLGMRVYLRTRLRVAGIDAPEMSTDAGKAAKCFVLDQLCAATEHREPHISDRDCLFVPVTVRTSKPDKYGRALADVVFRDMQGADLNLGTVLVDDGHARPYDGGRR